MPEDDDVIADGYAVINDGSSAYPDVISNSDGFTDLLPLLCFDGVQRVRGGIDMYRREHTIIAMNWANIKHDAVEARKSE